MSYTDPLFVVAADYKAFLDWCERKGLSPLPAAGQVIYVADARKLLGQRDVRILFLHGWTQHRHARSIYNRALIVGRRPS